MSLPEFFAWQRLAVKRVLRRRNQSARAEWEQRLAGMKARGG